MHNKVSNLVEGIPIENEIKSKLEERNRRIIQAVIKKMESQCPGLVALIGVGGSFYSGDIHEKSDLDLLIVINDDKARCLSSCFILDGVGFDIYCSKWSRLEHMAEYKDPYSGKLIDLEIVYVLDKEAEERYYKLQEKLLNKLNSPLSQEDVQKAKDYLHKAEQEYIEIMINDDMAKIRYLSAILLYYLEFSLYMLNKKIVKYGIKRIPQEIRDMPILPGDFLYFHDKLVRSETSCEIKASCTELIKITRECFKGFETESKEKKELTAKDIVGTYEEIYSNWRIKMFHSIDINSPYLSFQTVSSCQHFYRMMSDEFNIDVIDVMKNYSPSDLTATAAYFDMAMEEYLELYKRLNVDVVRYETIEEFEESYLT